MILNTSLLSTQWYKVRINLSNPGKGVAPSHTPQCSSYWKGSLLVAFDFDQQLYLLPITITAIVWFGLVLWHICHCKLLMLSPLLCWPVGWGCRIHRLLLCWGIRPPPTRVQNMTLNNLMVKFQECWNFRKSRLPLYCHRSRSGSIWSGNYLWVK